MSLIAAATTTTSTVLPPLEQSKNKEFERLCTKMRHFAPSIFQDKNELKISKKNKSSYSENLNSFYFKMSSNTKDFPRVVITKIRTQIFDSKYDAIRQLVNKESAGINLSELQGLVDRAYDQVSPGIFLREGSLLENAIPRLFGLLSLLKIFKFANEGRKFIWIEPLTQSLEHLVTARDVKDFIEFFSQIENEVDKTLIMDIIEPAHDKKWFNLMKSENDELRDQLVNMVMVEHQLLTFVNSNPTKWHPTDSFSVDQLDHRTVEPSFQWDGELRFEKIEINKKKLNFHKLESKAYGFEKTYVIFKEIIKNIYKSGWHFSEKPLSKDEIFDLSKKVIEGKECSVMKVLKACSWETLSIAVQYLLTIAPGICEDDFSIHHETLKVSEIAQNVKLSMHISCAKHFYVERRFKVHFYFKGQLSGHLNILWTLLWNETKRSGSGWLGLFKIEKIKVYEDVLKKINTNEEIFRIKSQLITVLTEEYDQIVKHRKNPLCANMPRKCSSVFTDARFTDTQSSFSRLTQDELSELTPSQLS